MANKPKTFDYSNIINLNEVESYIWDLITYVTAKKIKGRSLKDIFNAGIYSAKAEEVLAHELQQNELDTIASSITSSASIKEGVDSLEKIVTKSAEILMSSTNILQTPVKKEVFVEKIKQKLNQSSPKSKKLLGEILDKSEFYSRLQMYLSKIGGMDEYSSKKIPEIKSFFDNAQEDTCENIIDIISGLEKLRDILSRLNNLNDEDKDYILYAILTEFISFSNNPSDNDSLSDVVYTIKLLNNADKCENKVINWMITYALDGYEYSSVSQTNRKVLEFIKATLGLNNEVDALYALTYYCSKLQKITLEQLNRKYEKCFLDGINKDYMLSKIIIDSL